MMNEPFRYILSPFGLGCEECDYLKAEVYPVLIPLLEKLLRIVVEINTQAANDAACMGVDGNEKTPSDRVGTLPTDLWNMNFKPFLWLAQELKRQSRKKIKAKERRPRREKSKSTIDREERRSSVDRSRRRASIEEK
mmetsp:Transcript_53670/g.95698  ORF Transcript_53670/g.95698 Transcript_53670/m.95698 type:complete len:137 (-) Transcript_53670:2961-3371(-)